MSQNLIDLFNHFFGFTIMGNTIKKLGCFEAAPETLSALQLDMKRWYYFISQFQGFYSGYSKRRSGDDFTSYTWWKSCLLKITKVNMLKQEATFVGIGISVTTNAQREEHQYPFMIKGTINKTSISFEKSHYTGVNEGERRLNILHYCGRLVLSCISGEDDIPILDTQLLITGRQAVGALNKVNTSIMS